MCTRVHVCVYENACVCRILNGMFNVDSVPVRLDLSLRAGGVGRNQVLPLPQALSRLPQVVVPATLKRT